MANFTCPSCDHESFSLKDKYTMGYWMIRKCSHCQSIVAANPIILGVLTFAYLWNVLMFGALTFFDRDLDVNWWDNIVNGAWHYILIMIILWAILDFINIKYVPLMIVRHHQ